MAPRVRSPQSHAHLVARASSIREQAYRQHTVCRVIVAGAEWTSKQVIVVSLLKQGIFCSQFQLNRCSRAGDGDAAPAAALNPTMWTLLLLTALPALVGVAGEGPQFLPTRRALAAAPGGEARLACRVARLGDTAVSWVRARDLHILTHAGAVFSADPRVAVDVAAARGAVTHTLRLARLRAADAGRYECQLNTDPKRSQIYDLVVTEEPQPRLEVTALRARVRGAAGGAATLGCEARLLHAPPAAAADALRVAWFRDGRPLEPQGGRAGGVSLETERRADGASARLTLAALAAADAGAYSCRAAAAGLRAEAAVTLLVGGAEAGEMEAMQRDQWPAAPAAAPPRAPPALAAALAAAALAAARRRR